MSTSAFSFSNTRISRSGRRKVFFNKVAFSVLGCFFLICFLVVFCLSLYSPLMLNRDSAGLKEWFPNFVTFVKRNSFVALKQNGYAVLNVLFTREPPTRSEIPTINIYVRNNSFEG